MPDIDYKKEFLKRNKGAEVVICGKDGFEQALVVNIFGVAEVSDHDDDFDAAESAAWKAAYENMK